ncbi:MAG: tetratricopeptide repeat protein [Desulfobacterales bacterium]|nr:tetratricopeptide repeat protein [Desulfobacterales bacterium]
MSVAFPEIGHEEDFIRQAMARVEPSFNFSAMVIRMDPFEEKAQRSGDDPKAIGFLAAAKIVHVICQTDGGIWGRLGPDLLGAYFPGQSRTSALNLAGKIQQACAAAGKNTVSIGIADYPSINFHKDQILDNAFKALDHAAFFGPGSMVAFDAVSLNISGDILYQQGDIHGAIKEFKDGLLLDPSNLNLHNSLGVCYGALGAYDRAREEFETAAGLDATESLAIYNIGMVTLLTGDKDRALDYFLKARSLGKDISEVEIQIGRIYFARDCPENALAYFENAARLNPVSNPAFRYLGECCLRLNQSESALQAFKKAIKINPGDAVSLSALGHLYFCQGRNLEIAQTFCEQSVEIEPENGLFRHRLGQLHLGRNRLEDALQAFEKAEQLGHDSHEFIQQVQARLSACSTPGAEETLN